MRYFIAGHFWLFVACVLFFGQEPNNWEDHSRFLGVGRQFSDVMYFATTLLFAAFGALHLFRAWKADGSIELMQSDMKREKRSLPNAAEKLQQPV